MKEQASTEIILHDMDPAAVELLIEYGYTGQIVITPDNVQVLLPASSILQMITVREACCRFLMKQLHPTNCLGIRSFAGINFLMGLRQWRLVARGNLIKLNIKLQSNLDKLKLRGTSGLNWFV